MTELERVDAVLYELAREQPIWRKNLQTWRALDKEGRYYFWERAKKQATAGVVMWEEVLIRTVEKRLL